MNGFYWIYLILVVFLIAYERTDCKDRKRMLYCSALGFLILMFALQDKSVSMDTRAYMYEYDLLPGLSFSQYFTHKFEIGYLLLCRLIQCLFVSERMLLVSLALLILIPFGRSFEQETEAPMVALLAFVSLGMYIHAIIYWRQLAAMAILCFGYRYMRERKFLPFLLIVLLSMSFHKTAVVFIPLYVVYRIPINKWLLLFCGICAGILSFFGDDIIRFGVTYLYPRYRDLPLLPIGGYNLLISMSVVLLLSYWVFRDRLDEDQIRLPFLMLLVAVTIQPICFAFYNWLRIVLYFRIALVPMTAQLYVALFRQKENNRLLQLIAAASPGLHRRIAKLYDAKWFPLVTQLCLFAVLFVWYLTELDGAVYIMAPIE